MGFEQRRIDWRGANRGYQVFVPESRPRHFPVLLFLHGMGESGADNERQTSIGVGRAIREASSEWPFLTIFPQKSEAAVLWPGYVGLLNEILIDVETSFSVSSSQRFITGLSQGGNGTFELFNRLKWRFTAAAPVCGWADPAQVAEDARDLPMWIFHGRKDQTVPPSCSESVYDFMVARGIPNKKLTIFPQADHNSWDAAYLDSGLFEWMLSL
jgi:predicted peptidase